MSPQETQQRQKTRNLLLSTVAPPPSECSRVCQVPKSILKHPVDCHAEILGRIDELVEEGVEKQSLARRVKDFIMRVGTRKNCTKDCKSDIASKQRYDVASKRTKKPTQRTQYPANALDKIYGKKEKKSKNSKAPATQQKPKLRRTKRVHTVKPEEGGDIYSKPKSTQKPKTKSNLEDRSCPAGDFMVCTCNNREMLHGKDFHDTSIRLNDEKYHREATNKTQTFFKRRFFSKGKNKICPPT